MEEMKSHWNLYYLFLWDSWEHTLPPQAQALIAAKLLEEMKGREAWIEKN